jgi:hypothetical protein
MNVEIIQWDLRLLGFNTLRNIVREVCKAKWEITCVQLKSSSTWLWLYFLKDNNIVKLVR